MGFISKAVAVALLGATVTPALGSSAPEDLLACGGAIDGPLLVVMRDESLCEWPFDVESMRIGCDAWGPRSGELYFSSEKGAFGLNGSGKSKFGDPRPIWLDATGWAGGKVSVQPWIDAALGLCE